MTLVAPQSGHRRLNPLTGEWVLVSPHRLDRPWQGARATRQPANSGPTYDPNCYLCPGNTRANGEQNPQYEGVWVFDNDFPALQGPTNSAAATAHPLLQSQQAEGVCRVICFSPDHSRTLSHLDDHTVTQVVSTWCEQSAELGARYPDGSVQIFENKGELMGCSNPHPHGQIWAQQSIPTLLDRELNHTRAYRDNHREPLLHDYANLELESNERVVSANEHFVVVVPFWATWPFETLLVPRRSVARLPMLNSQEKPAFAAIMRELSIRYDNLFGVSFPYSAGIHQAPASGAWDDAFTLHMHFYPPLLRSAEVRKFMVGYEMLAEAQRDLTPEHAAAMLRELPTTLVTASA